MAVGMGSSDDEFGILAAEPCLDKGVFQNGYLMHDLAFACNDIPPLPHVSFIILKPSEWCAFWTVARYKLALLPVCGVLGAGACVVQVKHAHALRSYWLQSSVSIYTQVLQVAVLSFSIQ